MQNILEEFTNCRGKGITMIFITLGSQKFQFNRLLKAVDDLINEGVITEPVFAQIGNSDYVPVNFEYKKFIDREEFAKRQDECDIVITHGGTGAIIGAVKRGKKVIAVPRLAKYGEHVDDHQLQLLKQFENMHIIEPCYDVDNLRETYLHLLHTDYRPYVSNTMAVITSIDNNIQNELIKHSNNKFLGFVHLLKKAE